ncbi:glycosyltransferase family 2 protein [Eggerthella sp. YY7918]|uniref:glycosyltransferase family 2 protein n=1 Tax=Eggerthella sp. (strain YY7918) TaxID=502558 RepID=UPI000217112B|nr:glycosyltransferase family 2 protein [Eggerthella sp. YY7918]BAK44105.1 hypothetical protein EGYY_09160 [Eggerthella sp. YY7918]
MNKVTIIVPIYNTELFIEQCLDSLLNQSYSNIEIICVDDCGKDDSVAIASKYAELHPETIQIVRHSVNRGLGAARDTGIEHAQGEYIAFIDSDDYIKPDFIETYLESFFENESDVVIGGYIRDCEGEHTEHPTIPEDPLYPWASVSACCKMYRTSFLKMHSIDFRKERFYEDECFSYRLLIAQPKIKVLPYSGYYYRLNKESITRQRGVDRLPLVYTRLKTVEEFIDECYPACPSKDKEIFLYCLASGLTVQLLYNAKGCGINRMKNLYRQYNDVLINLPFDILQNRYVKLNNFKSEPTKSRLATWLIFKMRRIKMDRLIFYLVSLLPK